MRFPYVLLLSACALLIALPLAAQSSNGVLNGQVVDSSNSIIVGADIVAVNDVTGVQYTTKTNGEGIYVLPNLPPGPYRLQVSKFGFKTIIKPDIVVHVQDALALNFTLPVGATAEVVTVTGGGPLINTEGAAVSTVIDRGFVESLPLNGRSFNTLLQLTPGVVIAPAPVGGAALPGQFSIAGQRTNANNFTVDGVSANFGVVSTTVTGNSGTGSSQAFSALGGTSSLVSVDALQEFRVETSSFAPEFGRSPGGQIMLTTRSGTNTLHGGVFEYFRNNVLDANDWFANQAGLPRAPERHSNFGGFVGGPILKNKTFFFFSYEGARLRLPQTLPTPVPSEFARTTAPSAIAPYLNAFPRPDDRTITPGVYTAVFTGNYSNRATLDATSIRIDHKLNDRFAVFGRYNYAPSQTVNRTNSLNNLEAVTANTQTLTFGVNALLNGSVSNTIRGNYSTQRANNVLTMDSFGGAEPLDPTLLLGSLPISSNLGSFGTNDTGGFYLIGAEARNRTAQVNIVDDMAVATGTHQWKVGADYRAIFLNQKPNQSAIFLSADSVEAFVSTGNAGITTTNNSPARILSQSFSLYGQDTWKVTPRLTLTYGLRWELAPAPSGRGSTLLASWTNTNDPSRIALAPQGTPIWATTYANFAPRFGMAYSLTPQSDFVVRAGFGVFYDTTAGSVGALASSFPSNTSGPPPGVPTTVTLPVSDFTPYLSPVSLQPPFPPFTTGFANDLKFARSYQWNAALEKSFGERQALSATYVGQVGRNLLRQEGLFQPNPDFSFNFLLTGNTAHSNYHALQIQYRRPLSARVQALLNYTWSHSLDNASQDGVVAVSHTVISAARDYANSDFDVRHSFAGAVTLSLPSASKSGVLSILTQNWSLDTVMVIRTGFPFNAALLFGGPTGAGLSRPDLVSGQAVWISNATAPGGKSLNGAAFTIPPAGQQGTEPRNDIAGFGLTQVDLSIARKFAITNRLNLQLRADAFNVLNHPNFASPLGFVQLGSFFLSSTRMLNQGLGGLNPLFQQGGPRSLQLSLKLTF